MYNKFERHPKRFSLLLSIIFFLLYISTTPKFNVGYGDSDEFLAVGKTWGLAHPPGYTLYVTMLHVAMNLPIPFTNETQRAHLVSGVLSATSLYFTTLMLVLITKTTPVIKSKYRQFFRIASIVTTIITIATAKLFWTYSQIAEKYMLSSTLISIIMYYSTVILLSKKKNIRDFLVLSFMYGLLIAHHQSAVFLLPYLAFILYDSKIYTLLRAMAGIGASLLLGFIVPQGLLLLRSNPGLQVSWYMKPGIGGIIDFLTRADFRGNIYYSNTLSSGYFPNSITINQILNGSSNYIKTMLESFSWWILLPVLVTIITLWIKNKKILLKISIPFLLIGVALSSYMNWPTDIGSQAMLVRFYVPSFTTFAPLVCLGLIEIMHRLSLSINLLGIKQQGNVIIGMIAIIIPSSLAFLNYQSVNLSRFDLVHKLYNSIIAQVEPNSIITCYSDSSCFALLYEQTVNQARPDVDVVPLAYPLVKRKMNDHKLSKLSYVNNPYMMLDIVTWNIGKRPVYAVDISKYYFSLFGIENGYMYYIPEGYIGKLDRTMPTVFKTVDTTLSEKYSSQPIDDSNTMQRYLIQSLSQTHMTNGYMWLKIGDRQKARDELNTGVNLVYNLSLDEKKAGSETRTQIERVMADSKFAPGSKVIDSNILFSYVSEYIKQNQYRKALIITQGALSIDPTNIPARLELARMYEKFGDTNFSNIEYKNVLILDPQNQEANQKVTSSN